MLHFLTKMVVIVILLSFHNLSIQAQVVNSSPSSTQVIQNQKITKELQKQQKKIQHAQEKAQKIQQKAQQKMQQAQQGADLLNNGTNKIKQKISKLTNLGDSLSNLTLLSKRRRDSLLWKNLYFGGDFGLSVGAKQIFVNVSPLVGFKLSNKFSLGGGFVFQYLRTQVVLIDPIQGVNIKQTAQTLIYGGRGFSRLFVHKRLFAQADFELINVQLPTVDGSTIRNWVPGASAGAGYSFDIGRGMGLNVIASYNFLYQEGRSPYSSPLDVRFGIQF